MDIWRSIASAIEDATLRPFDIARTTPVSGGSINESYRLDGRDDPSYFVKLNDAQHLPMFAAEASGLAAIAATNTLHTPRPITHGIAGSKSFLVLEHLALTSHGDARLLGTRLAAMHRNSAPQFGFIQDNFIGTTTQANTWTDDWISFWREQRLGFQLELAAKNGHGGELQRLGARLLEELPAFFENHAPQPSLLHGDLWSGNHAYLGDGTPTLFDPASYFGDRECDIAMSELFGGFPSPFYDAYRTAWPLNEGYEKRRDLYNLYHLLNHTNLFGGGYVRQSEQTMRRLLQASDR
ncbi:MAG: fructosamine kinase family protein [Sideroxydans sp.]|jgi:fructosamine-3-kinase